MSLCGIKNNGPSDEGPKRSQGVSSTRPGATTQNRGENAVPNANEITIAVLTELNNAREAHPRAKSLWAAAQLIQDRAETCRAAAGSTADPEHDNCTAQLAIEVAALAVRLIQDWNLPLPAEPKDAD